VSVFDDQHKFMTACGQTTDFVNHKQVRLYEELIREEIEEWDRAHKTNRFVDQVDAALDIMYVLIGWMHSNGLQPQELWDEVQRSNEAKIDSATGLVHRRPDGKILKPTDWSPPDLVRILTKQIIAHQRTA
jgi:predicted HAD superfamily Cof-like phosphohydrolase